MTKDDLLDALSDLQHNLGKHIAMPVTMIPADAGDADLRDGLWRALRGPRGDAAGLWQDFLDEAGDAFDGSSAWTTLTTAVNQALAWELRLDDEDPLDRARLTADLCAVGTAIRALTAQLLETP